MTTSTLRENIQTALVNSSSQMPVDLTQLKTLLSSHVKWDDLNATLESMCENRELQTCSGIKGGKDYVCYWISGNLPPAWGKPSKSDAKVKK
jgi:hypothetical protein